jgi:hypothetical protein
VIAPNHHHWSDLRQVEKCSIDDGFVLGRRRGDVEEIAYYEGGINPAIPGNPDDLVEDGPMLVGPRTAADLPPDVPIGGVEQSHGGNSTFILPDRRTGHRQNRGAV